MSRDDILNMPVGRELDALVAEKVMLFPLQWDEGEGQSYRFIEDRLFGDILKPFNPSTDISAAFEVVEQIKKKFTLRITINQSFTSVEYWNHKTARLERSLTTPEAICKAALLAVME